MKRMRRKWEQEGLKVRQTCLAAAINARKGGLKDGEDVEEASVRQPKFFR
jgi:hypothetical protein